jgi:SP family sugar:H+ symporter-like MFS transporter
MSYGFYAVCALLSLLFVVRWVRETKGKEMEDTDDFMTAAH